PKAAELRRLDVLARQAADLIEGKRTLEALRESVAALRQSEENLALELDAARHLQQVSMHLIQTTGVEPLYEQIIDAAVGIMHSDFASMQLFYPERGTAGELRLLGHRGLTPEAAKFFEWVSPASACSCGMALNTRQRVILPDVRRVFAGDGL